MSILGMAGLVSVSGCAGSPGATAAAGATGGSAAPAIGGPKAVAAPASAPAAVRPVAATPVGAAATVRTAMDLLANRVHASSYQNGHLVVDAGSTDFLKYTDGGWKTSWIFGESDQGHPVALVAGLSAQLFLPVPWASGDGKGSSPTDAVLSFSIRALAPRQKVSTFVNERAVGTLDIGAQTQRYRINIPSALLHAGDNRIRFTFRAATKGKVRRSAAAFTDLTFGPRGSEPPASPHIASVSDVDLGGSVRSAVSIPGPSSQISFYVQVPEAASLNLSYGSAVKGARAEVRIASDRRPAEKPLLESRAAGPHWTEASLWLGANAGQAVRIDLISKDGAVSWANLRLAVKGESASRASSPRRTATPVDHIFVWMVDTLRADKVRAFNPHTRVETPNYDAFAADATRFAWAQVPGTWSLPSHASLLTGVYPPVHKATSPQARVSREVSFIAEELKKKGFKTAMFSSNGYVSAKWGFDRGWDVYRNFIREDLPNGAEYLWKTAKPWLLQNARKREFAYLATVDPHVAYTPRAEFLKKYWNKPYKGPLKPALTGVQLGLIGSGKLKIDDNDKAYLEALHDGEISQSDAAFATFIADLKRADLYDRSAVIVVSDHGDEFGEHGRFGHGQSVYQELTHVPLIIRAPGRMPIGKVVNADVEIMDLYATILDLAGEAAGEHIEGISLVPLAWDEIGETPRAALSIDTQVARGLKVGRYRLVAALGRFELYDEVEDRLEQKDVAAARPIALRQMRSVLGLLHAYETRWSKSEWGTAANLKPKFAQRPTF